MLSYALGFLVIAVIAAMLGFSGIAGTSVWIAEVLFVVALVMIIVSFVTGGKRGVS